MKYKAVIVDVDGTIIPPSEIPAPSPSIKLTKAVEEVVKKGVFFTLATGRAFSYAQKLIERLDINAPVVLDNGANIYDPQRKIFIWQSFIPNNKVLEVYNFLRKDKTLRIYVIEKGIRIEDLDNFQNRKINRILVLGLTREKADEVYNKLRIFIDLHITKTITGAIPHRESILITNKEATKKLAIEMIIKIMKIKKEEVIGIGDSYNDVPLFESCGLKIAMGNSVDEIKKIADYIAPSYEKDGVVEVLKRFILRK